MSMSLSPYPSGFNPLEDAFGMSMLPRSWYDWDQLSPTTESTMTFQPRMDISESDKEICVHAEMPGIKKEDLNVEMSNNILTISGKKERCETLKDSRYRRSERSFGAFQTRVRVPQGTQAEGIRTAFNNGVLEVRVQKPKQAEGKKIPIE